ncbi:Sigma-24 (FecI) [Sphingobium chlorophenolicum]|uniref:Sigma-24 (FecI) n=1 Tax=Sphingobium chlorophenolicum TaxID=46429 RepID=A0A081RAG4_SPHCR|nr:sigma-70 family RNA polymerase sigma factor [Sphingobium chlorophenolicum]KEQ52187.1 Sigma-24 (FecI) [Sphingobium chlorophenolicum]
MLKDGGFLGSDRVALRLYKSHRESLVTYAGRLSGDPAAAEDIVHDAWLLFDRQPAPDQIREPLSYLKRIVRNLVFAQVRHRRREPSLAAPEAGAVVEMLMDDRPSVEADLIARDDMRLVMQVVNGLPARQSAAFKMYHFEELKLREIAIRLGVSVSLTHLLITEAMELCDEMRKRSAQ